jgi:hypothetical protein
MSVGRIAADNGRLDLLAILENHRDFIGFFDDMVVGDDDAIRADDETGAE